MTAEKMGRDEMAAKKKLARTKTAKKAVTGARRPTANAAVVRKMFAMDKIRALGRVPVKVAVRWVPARGVDRWAAVGADRTGEIPIDRSQIGGAQIDRGRISATGLNADRADSVARAVVIAALGVDLAAV